MNRYVLGLSALPFPPELPGRQRRRRCRTPRSSGHRPLSSGATGGGLPCNLSANSAGYSAKEIHEQVNVINTEDIVKYSPDTMTRKRYIGDRNAIIETRTASVTASARSLVYADGFPAVEPAGQQLQLPAALEHGRPGRNQTGRLLLLAPTRPPTRGTRWAPRYR